MKISPTFLVAVLLLTATSYAYVHATLTAILRRTSRSASTKYQWNPLILKSISYMTLSVALLAPPPRGRHT